MDASVGFKTEHVADSARLKPGRRHPRIESTMYFSAGVMVGVGLALAARASSFALVQSVTSPARTAGVAGHDYTRTRSRVLSLGAKKKRSELDDVMDEVTAREDFILDDDLDGDLDDGSDDMLSGTSVADLTSEVAAPKKSAKSMGEAGDVVMQAARTVTLPKPKREEIVEDEIVPMHAGLTPLPPGKIALNPMEGMDADDVPGKIILDQATLAEQQRGLEKIAQQLRRERLDKEAVDKVLFGFCPTAELWNGRSAMFGITVGLLTEYWTGQSIPQQIETLVQVLGLVPLDYESYFS